MLALLAGHCLLAAPAAGAGQRGDAPPAAPALERHFDEMDANRDGAVSREELRTFNETRRAQRETRERLREDREQRLRLREDRAQRLRQRVDRADADGDGAVTRAEARQRMPRVHEHFDQIDADRDGSVTPDEIRAFWRKRAQERRIQEGGRDPRF